MLADAQSVDYQKELEDGFVADVERDQFGEHSLQTTAPHSLVDSGTGGRGEEQLLERGSKLGVVKRDPVGE